MVLGRLATAGILALSLTLGCGSKNPGYPGVVVRCEERGLDNPHIFQTEAEFYLHVRYTDPETGKSFTRRHQVESEDFFDYSTGSKYP